MDVSIAVSLIRGQMGTVVERAVNVAVETVLAEMLKVVGVKFEELKSQVSLMKRDVAALQREKAQKEKENDNIRAKLRYTELKLKYYRQGVEEELQQRASASTLVRIHPFPQTQRGGAALPSAETSPTCSTQDRTTEGTMTKSSQECTSPQSTSSCPTVRVRCPADVGVASSDSAVLMPASLSVNTSAEHLDSSSVSLSSTDPDAAESVDADVAPPPVQTLKPDPVKPTTPEPPSPDGSTPQADSSTLPSAAPQVKQEDQQLELQDELICIKEEPEEEREVTATLLLDCKVQQTHVSESEAQSSVEWTGLTPVQKNHTTTFSSAGPSSYMMIQPSASTSSMVMLPSGVPSRQMMRPWTKDLSLYEEYRLRRNELRRRNLNRRRELEKTLPQPLLADMVRERREKTRLRVARWRAKRKLQACLNQTQTQSGAAALSHNGFPLNQHQQLRVTYASSSNSLQRPSSSLLPSSSFPRISSNSSSSSISVTLPFITSTSSSSSFLLRSPNMAAHQHAVTSTSPSSSSYPQISLSQQQQSVSLTDADVEQ